MIKKYGNFFLKINNFFVADSVIFTRRPGEHMPETSSLLGALTDELKSDEKALLYTSIGPKSYSLVTKRFDPKKQATVITEHTRSKGFTLSYNNAQLINHQSMLDLVQGYKENVTTVNPYKIWRDKSNYEITTREEIKKLSFNFTKRRIVRGTYITLPFGFTD